mgnify:FL=1
MSTAEGKRGGCLICGKPLVYYETGKRMKCSICGKEEESEASCEDGHFVCDECHSKRGIQVIEEGCRKTESRNPIAIMQELMENPYIYMHGPEHHVMVGAAILTACKNSGVDMDFDLALEEMVRRGREVPGGICGFWGCCGAAVSTGTAYSILLKATPLSGNSWGRANGMTSRALAKIAEKGGPRCCKRDSFLAVQAAAEVLKEEMNICLEMPEEIFCAFSRENPQCLRRACPFYRQGSDTAERKG